MSGDHNQHQKPTSKDSLQVEAITPAVWVCMDNDRVMRFRFDKPKDIKNWKPMYSEPPQEDWQAIAADQAMTIAMMKQRQWVGLTDEQIAEAVGSPVDEVYLADFRKVEAKLKEKNT
jgi:hypothetical protein